MVRLLIFKKISNLLPKARDLIRISKRGGLASATFYKDFIMKLNQIKQIANKFFNDVAPKQVFGETQQPLEDDNITIDPPEDNVFEGLMRAMAQAIDKKAKKDVATLYRFNRTRWVLTHVEIFVKSTFKDRQVALARLAPKTLKSLFLSTLKKSPNADMFKLADFSGVTLTLEPQTDAAEFLQVLAVYDEDNVAYHFAFDGEIDIGEEVQEDESPSSMGRANVGKSQVIAATAPVLLPILSSGTPLLEDLCLGLASSAFWPAGWGHPFANPYKVNVFAHQLPLVIGRTQQAASQSSGAGHGVQIADSNDGAGYYLPIYGCEVVSSQHVTISYNEAGVLCATDQSTNGTWVNGKRLPHGVPTPLSQGGVLSLCAAQAGSGKPSIQLRFSQTGEVEAASDVALQNAEAAKAPSTATPISPAPIAELALPLASLDTKITAPSTAAKETQLGMTDEPPAAQALANVLVRMADGHIAAHPITHYPLTIGRESTCDVQLPESCSKTSREHLVLERPLMRASGAGTNSLRGFHVSNKAVSRNGTFCKGQREDESFVLPVHLPSGRAGTASQDGWITLGEAALSGASVQVKLEAVV
jgi:pSer/pThr/pTyr-binding forkhead associated (FHA) protein